MNTGFQTCLSYLFRTSSIYGQIFKALGAKEQEEWICKVARLMEERERRRSRAQDAFISLEDEQRRRTRAHAFIISVFSELSLVNTHFIMAPPPPFSGNSR